MRFGESVPERLMAELFEPESSKVTLSPDVKETRFVPLKKLAGPELDQMLAMPSPRQMRLSAGGTGADIKTPIVLL
jgi:hypothetical protein